MSRRAYANLELDATKIDIPRMADIAEVYGLEIDELLNFNENQAFTNCFNNNINGFFNAEKVQSGATKEDKEYFITQLHLLLNSFNEERKVFLDILHNLKKIIEKTD